MHLVVTQLTKHDDSVNIFKIDGLPETVEWLFGSLTEYGKLLFIHDGPDVVGIQVVILDMLNIYPVVLERKDVAVPVHVV